MRNSQMLLRLNFDNMFTGIIETPGIIKEITTSGTNKSFWVESAISSGLTIDQSIAHNGVCLTVEAVEGNLHKVTAIQETLQKTSLNNWKKGSYINLERCLQPSGRLDGHFVQGHVDTTGTVSEKKDLNGSWQFTIHFPPAFAHLVIEKGSVSLDGISLTIFNITNDSFSVAIIPYTYEHTNLQQVQTGDVVNIEFDMVGKYISRSLQINRAN
jgi:riboflavin synthase